jgi:hypothetical protein
MVCKVEPNYFVALNRQTANSWVICAGRWQVFLNGYIVGAVRAFKLIFYL